VGWAQDAGYCFDIALCLDESGGADPGHGLRFGQRVPLGIISDRVVWAVDARDRPGLGLCFGECGAPLIVGLLGVHAMVYTLSLP
jgi:hypothetical protein